MSIQIRQDSASSPTTIANMLILNEARTATRQIAHAKVRQNNGTLATVFNKPTLPSIGYFRASLTHLDSRVSPEHGATQTLNYSVENNSTVVLKQNNVDLVAHVIADGSLATNAQVIGSLPNLEIPTTDVVYALELTKSGITAYQFIHFYRDINVNITTFTAAQQTVGSSIGTIREYRFDYTVVGHPRPHLTISANDSSTISQDPNRSLRQTGFNRWSGHFLISRGLQTTPTPVIYTLNASNIFTSDSETVTAQWGT